MGTVYRITDDHHTSRYINAWGEFIPFQCISLYDQQVPIEAAHLYDAVTLWARAATAAMRAGLPPTDGATLMKLLRPTTYRSVQGFDVSCNFN